MRFRGHRCRGGRSFRRAQRRELVDMPKERLLRIDGYEFMGEDGATRFAAALR